MTDDAEKAARLIDAMRANLGRFDMASRDTCGSDHMFLLMANHGDIAMSHCRAAIQVIQQLQRARDAALREAGEQSRLRGVAEGKLAGSEAAGTVDGWRKRAEREATAAASVMEFARKALHEIDAYQGRAPSYLCGPGHRGCDGVLAEASADLTVAVLPALRAALAAYDAEKGGTDG